MSEAAGIFRSTNPKRFVKIPLMDAAIIKKKRGARPAANAHATERTRRWGRRLAADVQSVLALHPEADPEVVRLTLISLQSPPLERLNRSLRRGRGFAAFKR